MSATDIGVNFHSSQLRGLAAELLERARVAGVGRVIATGTSLAASRSALALARAHAGVWATAGVHPHDARHCDTQTLQALQTLWREPRVVAVGECGLDYDRMFSPADVQRRVFEHQIEAAIAVGKPLFLHCRAAFDDFRALLKSASQAGVHGVVHCFTGDADQARQFLDMGFDIGVTGWITDQARGQDLRDAMRAVPLDRLHLETDAPYLRPRNADKTRPYNEPALLPFIARAVAELKGLEAGEVAEQAARNSARLFALGD